MRLVIFLFICLILAGLITLTQLSEVIDYKDQMIKNLQAENDTLEQEINRLQEIVGEIREIEEYIYTYNKADTITKARKIYYGAKRHDLPVKLILIACNAESNFKWDAIGSSGEHGTLQVMPNTFKLVMPEGDFNNWDDCFEAGLRYLKLCYTKSNGDKMLTLARYNSGLGRNSEDAFHVARLHVSRCIGIRRNYEQHRRTTIATQGSTKIASASVRTLQ
jgi:cell division protein FtsB